MRAPITTGLWGRPILMCKRKLCQTNPGCNKNLEIFTRNLL